MMNPDTLYVTMSHKNAPETHEPVFDLIAEYNGWVYGQLGVPGDTAKTYEGNLRYLASAFAQKAFRDLTSDEFRPKLKGIVLEANWLAMTDDGSLGTMMDGVCRCIKDAVAPDSDVPCESYAWLWTPATEPVESDLVIE